MYKDVFFSSFLRAALAVNKAPADLFLITRATEHTDPASSSYLYFVRLAESVSKKLASAREAKINFFVNTVTGTFWRFCATSI